MWSAGKADAADEALRRFWQQPYGRPLLVPFGLALIAFGLYELAEATYRRIPAADRPAHQLLGGGAMLLAPYLSVPKLASIDFPFFPSSYLALDRFENERKISKIHSSDYHQIDVTGGAFLAGRNRAVDQSNIDVGPERRQG